MRFNVLIMVNHKLVQDLCFHAYTTCLKESYVISNQIFESKAEQEQIEEVYVST